MGVGQDYGVSQIHLISFIIIPSHIHYHYSYCHIIFTHSQLTLSFILNSLSLYSLGRVGSIAQFDRGIHTSLRPLLYFLLGGPARHHTIVSCNMMWGMYTLIFIVDLHSLTQAYIGGDEGVIYHPITHHLSYHLQSITHHLPYHLQVKGIIIPSLIISHIIFIPPHSSSFISSSGVGNHLSFLIIHHITIIYRSLLDHISSHHPYYM